VPSRELRSPDELRARNRAGSFDAGQASARQVLARVAARGPAAGTGAVPADSVAYLQRTAGNQAASRILAPVAATVAEPLLQRDVPKGGAADHDWTPKSVPRRVKNWAVAAAKPVRLQYETTLESIATNPTAQGDGKLAYMNGWNHKRFGGHFCLLYEWAGRRDGKGWFLKVKGIGRKRGESDYELDD
jgi:hypothetical protein